MYYKRGEPGDVLLGPAQKLIEISNRLRGIYCSHLWPAQYFQVTPTAGYMMRQHVFANLYDRLSTRPFLTAIEKRWLTYQLLVALAQCQERGVCHGDIKCENVLVTSWNWALLTDFAAYKPTYLPVDNPADFSFYFDTGGRRRCYIAPERFYESSGPGGNPSAGQPLLPSMDIFSLGCVIAEIFLDGKAFFDLSQLLSYRKSEYDPALRLMDVDPEMRDLVLHMTQLSPADRWSASEYLTKWGGSWCPTYFSTLLHPFFNSIVQMDADARVAAIKQSYEQMKQQISEGNEQSGCAACEVSSPQVGAQPTQGVDPTEGARKMGSLEPTFSPLPAFEGLALEAGPTPEVSTLRASKMLREKLLELQADNIDHGAFLLEDSGPLPVAGLGSLAESTPTGSPTFAGQAQEGGRVAAGTTGDSVDQVVVEEMFEYQVWDPETKQWQAQDRGLELPCALSAQSALTVRPSGAPPQREYIRSERKSREDLLLGGEWQWADNWGVSGSEEADLEGWEYHKKNNIGGRGWYGSWEEGTLIRRRRWVRHRRRAAKGGGIQPGGSSEGAGPGASKGVKDDPLISHSSPLPLEEPQCEGMVLIAVLLCTLLRGCRLQESKHAAILLLYRTAMMCDDDVRLQCIVPHLMTLISDPAACVKSLALRAVVRIMAALKSLPPGDAKVFQDYLLPSLSLLPHDAEEMVRVDYALGLPRLAGSAHHQLLQMQQQDNLRIAAVAAQQRKQRGTDEGELEGDGVIPRTDPTNFMAGPRVRYDLELALVRHMVEKIVLELVTGTKTTSETKRGLVSLAQPLRLFFGRKDFNNLLLPFLITCLNASEWQLRAAFFEALANIGDYTGKESFKEILIPCLEQALQDAEATVIATAVRCLASVCPHLRKRSLLVAAQKVVGLLAKPQTVVRASAISFLAAAAKVLPVADFYTQLHPLLEPYMLSVPLSWSDERMLASFLKTPDQSQSTAEEDQVTQRVKDTSNMLASTSGSQYTALLNPPLVPGHPSASRMLDSGRSALPDMEARSSALGPRGWSPQQTAPHRVPLVPRSPSTPRHGNLDPPEAVKGLWRPVRSSPMRPAKAPKEPLLIIPAAAPIYRYDMDSLPCGVKGQSLHKLAVLSIERRQRELEERLRQLQPSAGVEGFAANEVESLKGTLNRLQVQEGEDVRDHATVTTYRLTQLSFRSGPYPSGEGALAAAASAASARLSLNLGQHRVVAGELDPVSMMGGGGVSDAVSAAMSTGILPPSEIPFGGNGRRATRTYLPTGQVSPPRGALGYGSSIPPWRPRGVLVAHLYEHRKAVNQLAVAANGRFFVSASNDETVKVWDLRRLETDVSFQSRLTYAGQSGAILALTPCEGDASIASASSNGSVQVWRVEYARPSSSHTSDKYAGVVFSRQLSPSAGSIMALKCLAPHLLVVATQRGGVQGWDLRCRGEGAAWTLTSPPSWGVVEKLVTDPDPAGQWFVTGTSRGHIGLWDVRFQLQVGSWRHPVSCPIDAMALGPYISISSSPGSATTTTSCPSVYVAAGSYEVSLLDVMNFKCHQVLRVDEGHYSPRDAPPETAPLSLQPSTPQNPRKQSTSSHHLDVASLASSLASALAIDQVNSPKVRPSGHRCLLPGPGGHLMTGGTDRHIRFWDPSWPERSYVVCGPRLPPQGEEAAMSMGVQPPSVQYQYRQRSHAGVSIIDEWHIQDVSQVRSLEVGDPDLRVRIRMDDCCHGDSITDMVVVDSPSGAPGAARQMLISCSRDGCVKAWR